MSLSETAAARAEHSDQPPVTCPWCFRAISPDEDEVEVRTATEEVYHSRCRFQQLDEEELSDYLKQVARDCEDRKRDYKAQHVSRALEHHARALLARLDAVVKACTDGAFTSPLRF